jgi:hypothetical protein
MEVFFKDHEWKGVGPKPERSEQPKPCFTDKSWDSLKVNDCEITPLGLNKKSISIVSWNPEVETPIIGLAKLPECRGTDCNDGYTYVTKPTNNLLKGNIQSSKLKAMFDQNTVVCVKRYECRGFHVSFSYFIH